MTYQLWLDDQSSDPATPNRHPPKGFRAAQSSAEAIAFFQEHGLPSFISFDHDLGGEDNAMVYLKYIAHHAYDGVIPEYQIHSANPVGAQNIHSFMQSWKKSREMT